MEMFEVGGCVRDEILGLKSKDIDFTVVMRGGCTGFGPTRTPFARMVENLKGMGFEIFQERPEFLTVRAKFPKSNAKYKGMTADFVLARKEGTYTDGRRPDFVELGRLKDDLARRDFTMNAIAKDAHGNLIDPFNGRKDIADRVIRAVGKAEDRIGEDALRGLRAIRFSVQKGFSIDNEVQAVLRSAEFRRSLRTISTERQREELEKAFKADTVHTVQLLMGLDLLDTLFDNTGLRLMPTMKG
jgi:tRNA nucleotidyltransferase (CCA-adding enzyme)